MPLTHVTLTGADDNTPVQALVEISKEFPFVEWGILVSLSQQGSSRFPSAEWINEFCNCSRNLKISVHVCGSWLRKILNAEIWGLLPTELPANLSHSCNRIQLNTHGEPHATSNNFFSWLAANGDKEFIIQLDGVNHHLLDAALMQKERVSGLFDVSHGAGRLPKEWPSPPNRWVCPIGYAGGLNPANLRHELSTIAHVCSHVFCNSDRDFWVDMETGIRDNEGRFDLEKVYRVLELTRPLIGLPNGQLVIRD